MDDIKKINRDFLFNLLLYIGILLVLIGAAIASYLLIENDNYTYLVWFILLIIALIVSGVFRSRIDNITNYSYIVKIRANAGDPIVLNKNIDIEKNLVNAGYELKVNKRAYVLYYKLVKDDIKRVFKRYM